MLEPPLFEREWWICDHAVELREPPASEECRVAKCVLSHYAEVLDAETLERVATLPMLVPRREAAAVALASGQILIVGGVDAAGAPISVMELFTPGP